MQGNIMPKEDELLENDENINFDSMELSKQLEIMYGDIYLGKNNDNKINNEKIISENENDKN